MRFDNPTGGMLDKTPRRVLGVDGEAYEVVRAFFTSLRIG